MMMRGMGGGKVDALETRWVMSTRVAGLCGGVGMYGLRREAGGHRDRPMVHEQASLRSMV